MMAREELQEWRAALVSAWRALMLDHLRRVQSYEASRLRPAAAASRERLRDVAESLYMRAEPMVDTVLPAVAWWAALAGTPALGRAEAEELIADYIAESRRQLAAVVSTPSADDLVATVERLVDRWRDRSPRIVERLARRLEESQ